MDWYCTMKNEFSMKVMKATTIEVEENFLLWKANHFDRCTYDIEQEIVAETRVHSESYLITTGQRLGLVFTRDTGAKNATIPPPTTPSRHKMLGIGLNPFKGKHPSRI